MGGIKRRNSQSLSDLYSSNRHSTGDASPTKNSTSSRSRNTITDDCSVHLTDILSELYSKINFLEKEIKTKTDSHSNFFDDLEDALAPLVYLANPPNNPNSTTLNKTSSIINKISTEIFNRISCANNVIIFNIPDRIPLESVKITLLNLCNINPIDCIPIRLRKKFPKLSCPILLKFSSSFQATKFLSLIHTLRLHSPFPLIKAFRDRTYMERQHSKRASDNTSLKSSTTEANVGNSSPIANHSSDSKTASISETTSSSTSLPWSTSEPINISKPSQNLPHNTCDLDVINDDLYIQASPNKQLLQESTLYPKNELAVDKKSMTNLHMHKQKLDPSNHVERKPSHNQPTYTCDLDAIDDDLLIQASSKKQLSQKSLLYPRNILATDSKSLTNLHMHKQKSDSSNHNDRKPSHNQPTYTRDLDAIDDDLLIQASPKKQLSQKSPLHLRNKLDTDNKSVNNLHIHKHKKLDPNNVEKHNTIPKHNHFNSSFDKTSKSARRTPPLFPHLPLPNGLGPWTPQVLSLPYRLSNDLHDIYPTPTSQLLNQYPPSSYTRNPHSSLLQPPHISSGSSPHLSHHNLLLNTSFTLHPADHFHSPSFNHFLGLQPPVIPPAPYPYLTYPPPLLTSKSVFNPQ